MLVHHISRAYNNLSVLELIRIARHLAVHYKPNLQMLSFC